MVWIKHYASKLAQAVSVGLDRRFPVWRTGGVTAQEYSCNSYIAENPALFSFTISEFMYLQQHAIIFTNSERGVFQCILKMMRIYIVL